MNRLVDYHVAIGPENELCVLERNLNTGHIETYPCKVCEDGTVRVEINRNNAGVN